MAKGIVIDLKSADDSTERRIDSVIDKLADLNASLQNVQTNFRAAASAGGQFASSRQSGARGGPRSGRVPPTDPRAVLADPNMRAQVLAGDPWAAQSYNKALSQQRAVTRAQKSINPPPPPGFGQNAMSLLMRSRYGGGGGSGGVMPLGMDVAKLFGGSGGAKAGGPIAIAAMVVIGTAKLVAAEFKLAARSAKEYADALVAGGRGAAGAIVLGQFTGAGAAGAAASVRGRSAREAAYGASRGISPLAGDPFMDPGGANKAYQKMAEAVAKAADAGGFDAAQREAYRLGSPELSRLGMLSKETRDQLLATGKRQGPVGSDRAFADLQAQLSIFAKEFGDLIKTHMINHVRTVTKMLSYLNRFLSWLNDQLKVLLGWTGAFDDAGKKASEHNSAMEEHTRAMKEHSEILGGDRRAQNAVPKAVQGNPAMWFDRDALRQSVRMGALV